MPNIARKRSAASPVMLAFAAALAAAPVVSPAAGTSSTSARAGDDVSTTLVPSAAALKHIKALSLTMVRPGPRWVEIWPEVTHVEAVRP